MNSLHKAINVVERAVSDIPDSNDNTVKFGTFPAEVQKAVNLGFKALIKVGEWERGLIIIKIWMVEAIQILQPLTNLF